MLRPYEFLARWGVDGALKGAHVQFQRVVMDGDEEIFVGLESAQPVAVGLGGEGGFPLEEIMSLLQADAVTAAQAALAACEAAEQARDAALGHADDLARALEESEAARAALAAQAQSALAAAAAEIANLKTALAVAQRNAEA